MPEQTATPKKWAGLWVAIFLIVFGFGATALTWYAALTENSHDFSTALVTPFVGSLGLAMLVAPEVEKVPAGPFLPSNHLRNIRRNLARAIVVLGLVGSIVNAVLISGWWP